MEKEIDKLSSENVEYYVAAAKANDFQKLYHMPQQLRNSATYMQIIEANPHFISDVPKKFRSSKLCRAAAKGLRFDSIDEWIENSPECFILLPTAAYSERTCYAFLTSGYAKRKYSNGDHLTGGLVYFNNTAGVSYIELDDILKWKSVCEAAVKLNWSLLGAVPEEFISYELCEMAVKTSYMALKYVPDAFKDEAI